MYQEQPELPKQDALMQLDTANFIATMPDTATRMLKIKRESLAELLEFHGTQKQAKEMSRQWNLKHNSDGDLWVPEPEPGQKRPFDAGSAEDEEEASAKTIPRKPDDPQDRKSSEAAAANFQSTSLDNLDGCAVGGHVFICSKSDIVAQASKPLCCLGPGKWLEKGAAANAVKNRKEGDWLIPFKVVDDEQLFRFTCKPEFADVPPFPISPQPLHKFLAYLEENGVADAKIVAHSPIQRSDAGERKRYATNVEYEVLFEPEKKKPPAESVWMFDIPFEHVEKSEHLRIVPGLEFAKKFQNTIVPALPWVYLKKPARCIKDEMYKLTG